MSLWQRLQEDMKTALKAGEREVLGVLRLLISAVKYAGIETQGEITDEVVVRVLQKEAKKRREAIEAYKQAGREELAEKERRELEVIKRYLPEMMSEAEVRKVVERVVKEREWGSFGELMGRVMKELKGKAEGRVVAKVVREML